MKAACREVMEIPSPGCCIPHEQIIQYFSIPSAPSIILSWIIQTYPDHPSTFLKPHSHQQSCGTSWRVRIIQAQAQIKLDTNTGKNLTLMALYSLLYSVNVELQLVPSSWKTSLTILLHKDGDLKEPSNWRPIALIDTIARLFTSCLATRLLFIIQKHSILSPEQKGFLPAEGFIEHNFMLQSILQHSKSNKKHLAAARLDIKNASGSTPHVD